MIRKRFEWKLKRREIQFGDRTLLVGVLNITPDSFSDGGNYLDADRAFARALELEEQGADILDIGAESTRPGSTRVSEAEEIRRLVPVLKRLRGQLAIPISVDTYKSAVAAKALELGAEIINDPTSLTFDPQVAKVVTQYDAGLILNHMRGTPETWAKLPPIPDVMGSILHDLDASVNRARHAGVQRYQIAIDPGLGFGKRKEQNAEILAKLPALARLDLPIMVGPSRKSFLAQPTETGTRFASAAAVAAAILGGAHMVRVHDVLEMSSAVQVADAILRARQE
ncbi:MAG: dihydropteroate synthase [Bryobacteraceae bacterium]